MKPTRVYSHHQNQWPEWYSSITENQGECRVAAFDLVPVGGET